MFVFVAAAGVIGSLSITGSNVGTTVKAEQPGLSAKNSQVHPSDRSRPPSKWCMCCVSKRYHKILLFCSDAFAALVISKGMQAVKLYTNKIYQFLTGRAS